MAQYYFEESETSQFISELVAQPGFDCMLEKLLTWRNNSLDDGFKIKMEAQTNSMSVRADYQPFSGQHFIEM